MIWDYGKTIQMLSVIVDYVQNCKDDKKENNRASIVISPSSLTLNWQNEATKFANGLKTIVIRGTLEERKHQIEQIDKFDLVITSYDLLKRDIELYQEKNYKFNEATSSAKRTEGPCVMLACKQGTFGFFSFGDCR